MSPLDIIFVAFDFARDKHPSNPILIPSPPQNTPISLPPRHGPKSSTLAAPYSQCGPDVKSRSNNAVKTSKARA